MGNIKYITIRFNLDDPFQFKAWEYLRNVKTKGFKSYSEAALTAIAEHFERIENLNDDPYFETRKKEDEFVNKIVQSVNDNLQKALPEFMLSCIANFATAKFSVTTDAITEDTTENTEIDWDFLGNE